MNLTRLESGSYQAEDDPGEPTTGVRRISVTETEQKFLADFARDCEVLELGTGLGVSTRALASTAEFVVTIDIDPWVRDHIWPELPANVRPTNNFEDMGPFDLIFIDADHETLSVILDLEHASACVHAGSMIVVHDAKMPQVAAALHGDWTLIDTHWGLAVQWVS